jgi:methyl-accepting chemotaxis protein
MRDWLFRRPASVTDPELARQWGLLNALLLLFLGIIGLIALISLFQSLTTLLILSVCGACFAGLYTLNRLGAVRAAALSTIAFLLLLLTVVNLVPDAGLIRGVLLIAMFTIPITLAGVVLPWRAVPGIAATCMVLITGLALFGGGPLHPYLEEKPTEQYNLLIIGNILLLVIGALATLSSRQVSRTFAMLQDRNRDLAAANANMRTQSDYEHQVGSDIAGMVAQLRLVAIRQMQGTNVQAFSINQVVGSVGELHQAADQIAALAAQVREAADSALARVEHGQELVQRSRAAIERNHTQVAQVIEQMTRLTSLTGRITKAMDAIRELADETHLLALNAAIEAAGAGTLGRRFSVVAGEVQNLAARSTGIVDDIQTLIGELHSAGQQTLIATQQSGEVAREVESLADQVRSVQGEVRDTVHSTSTLVHQIAVATDEQTTAARQVTRIMQQIAQVAEDTKGDTGTLQRAIADLVQAADRLNRAVEAATT